MQSFEPPQPADRRAARAAPDHSAAPLPATFTDQSPRGVQLRATAQLLRNSAPTQRLDALAARMAPPGKTTAQRKALPEEELLQGRFATVPRQTDEDELQMKAEAPPNRTGLPDGLKSGIETLSGLSMDHVRVHYNSSQPAQLNAHAYAQGSDIHLAPGQEQHLPHEAWHVVQQAQGRVQPTTQMKGGVPVNDDAGLEHEADMMGAKALQLRGDAAGDMVFTPNDMTVQRQAQADKEGDDWAQDLTVTWGTRDGKPVTIRVLARAFSKHFTSAWQDKIMASVQEMWSDIKAKRDDGTLKELSWSQYKVYGKTTDIVFSVDYDSRHQEVVVKHAHAVQDGDEYPAQLKTIRRGRPTQSVAQLAYINIGKVQVRCEFENDRKVVYLPAGFPPSKHAEIIDKLGLPPIFRNEIHDNVRLANNQGQKNTSISDKSSYAKRLIKDYVNSRGIKIEGHDLDQLIQNTEINFLGGTDWKQYLSMAGVTSSGLSSAEVTEGAVDPKQAVGERKVGINQDYHTVPAIVHELVHTLEHADLKQLPEGLVEGMTEWFALQAAGLTERRTRSNGTVYGNETGVVKLALEKGAITGEDLIAAYFTGNLDRIAKLRDAYISFKKYDEQTFLYKGTSATVDDPLKELENKYAW